MLTEFRAFLTRSNALALAIGVIIGVALGNVVNSLVSDIIMPPIGLALGGVDFKSLVIHLKDAVGDPSSKTYVPAVEIRYGLFINVVITFIIIAFVVFLIARALIKEPPAEPEPPTKQCPFCRESVLEEATKCRYCGSAI